MEAPGTKKPESNWTQTWNDMCNEAIDDLMDGMSMDPHRPWNEIIKDLDDLIEETLRRNEMKLPFYKRWYLWYKHWKLQRKYRNVYKI